MRIFRFLMQAGVTARGRARNAGNPLAGAADVYKANDSNKKKQSISKLKNFNQKSAAR